MPQGEVWAVLLDTEPKADWATSSLGEPWQSKALPMGFGYRNLATELDDMKGQFQSVYLRKSFDLGKGEDFTDLGLIAGWDDAMIVHLNGREVIRVGVGERKGAEASGLYSVGEARYGFFPIAAESGAWRTGTNTLAIEAHNVSKASSDFVVDAALVRIKPTTRAKSLPKALTEVIPRGAEWHYLAGNDPPGDWAAATFEPSAWLRGAAGFGYGDDDDDDDETVLEMKDRYTSVYLRQAFRLSDATEFSRLGLGIRWDDAFILYLNGTEVVRRNVREGAGPRAEVGTSIEAKKDYTAFPLGPFARYLKMGNNVIALEGHNVKKDSSDFSLDPFLFLADWEAP